MQTYNLIIVLLVVAIFIIDFRIRTINKKVSQIALRLKFLEDLVHEKKEKEPFDITSLHRISKN